MASILDHTGAPVVSRKLINAGLNYGRGVPVTNDFLKDFDDLVLMSDWRTILSKSRYLYHNAPVCRAAITQKADWTVGKAWLPAYHGNGKQQWSDAAKTWLINDFYPASDVRGQLYDYQSSIWLDCASVDHDGEIYILLTEDSIGFPKVQRLPAHCIGTRANNEKIIKEGRYEGKRQEKGIAYSKVGTPIAYHVLGATKEEDEWIPARNIVHIADPSQHCQGRGIPGFSACIQEIMKAKRSEDMELAALQILSSQTLIEYNEAGAVDFDDPGVDVRGGEGESDDKLVLQQFAEGTIRHFKSNSGSKLQAFEHNRPSDAYTSYIDRVFRSALASINWPYELVWKSHEINGTTIRNIQARAQMSVSSRQEVLKRHHSRIITWALCKAVKGGFISAPDKFDDMKGWSFSMPPILTIDPRNSAKTDAELYKLGATNMTTLLANQGLEYEPHVRQRCVEAAKRKLIKAEVEKEYRVEIDDREIQMLTPNEKQDDKK